MDKIQFISVSPYNGEKFPPLVNLLLQKFNLVFSGSSLIHDLYFPTEHWGKRDYDLWCNSENFNDVNRYLCMNGNVPIKMLHLGNKFCEIKSKRKTMIDRRRRMYVNFDLVGLSEYMVDGIKLQFINYGNRDCIQELINSFDFSFLQVFYDGKNLYYSNNPEDSSNKIGFINNNFKRERLEKYKNRGFKFTNLCFNCDKYKTADSHRILCSNCLNQIKFDSANKFIALEKFINIPKIEEKINSLLQKEQLGSAINMMIYTKQVNKAKELIEKLKDWIIESPKNIIRTIEIIAELQLTETFKKIYSLVKDKLTIEEKNGLLDKCNLNMLIFLQEIDDLYLERIEDYVLTKKFFTNEEKAEQHKDIIYLLDDNKFGIVRGTNNEDCPICYANITNAKKVNCGHYFCTKCLYKIIYERPQNERKCGLCRLPFN